MQEISSVKILMDKFNSIKNVSSRNAKEQLLKEYKSDDMFCLVLLNLLNPYFVTGLAKKKLSKKVDTEIQQDINSLSQLFNYIVKNNTGTDVDIATVQNYLSKLDKKESDFVSDIVTKSYKLGVTSKTVNKAFDVQFVPEFSVQLADSWNKFPNAVKGDFFITTKLDGHRAIAIVYNDKVQFFARSGKMIDGLKEIEQAILDNINTIPQHLMPLVLDGELLAPTLNETTSIVNSKLDNKTGLVYNVFDGLSLSEFNMGESDRDYAYRIGIITPIVEEMAKHTNVIKPIEILYYGDDKDKIETILEEQTELGEEGIMINIAKARYKTKRNKGLLKAKLFKSDDLKCVGVFEGEGKYVGMLGGIIVDYKNTLVDVGTGFTDEDRQYFWNNPDEILNSIVEVKYKTETENKRGNNSLQFPVFVRIRTDKDEVNIES